MNTCVGLMNTCFGLMNTCAFTAQILVITSMFITMDLICTRTTRTAHNSGRGRQNLKSDV